MTAPVLSARMAAVMRAVGAGRALSYNPVWRIARMDGANVSRTVDALVGHGLIDRSERGEVRLTPAGRAWLDAHPVAGAGACHECSGARPRGHKLGCGQRQADLATLTNDGAQFGATEGGG